jgi:hypothetical protein
MATQATTRPLTVDDRELLRTATLANVNWSGSSGSPTATLTSGPTSATTPCSGPTAATSGSWPRSRASWSA